MQAFTNCLYSYDPARNVHASNVTRTQKPMHSIDSSMLKLFEFASLSVFYFIFFCPVLGWFYHVLLPMRAINCENCQLSTGAFFTLPHRPLWFKKTRKTTTTAFLFSSTVVPNPYIHSIAFNPQSFTQLS